jgi:hypothetical protein
MEEVKTSEGFLVLKVSNQELAKAAEKYFEEYYKYDDAIYKRDVLDIFIAGAKFIINNTQK